MWDFHKDSAHLRGKKKTQRHRIFLSARLEKKSRANNTTPIAHKQQSKTRTEEHTELEKLENNEHKNGPGFI